jgi:hypothetical protein
LEAIMTSVHALPGLASKIFYFSLVASVFTFVSMLLLTCPYRKSNPYVLMVQPSKNRPHLDAPGALNEPSNRRILA